jgi:hypothetical protein
MTDGLPEVIDGTFGPEDDGNYYTVSLLKWQRKKKRFMPMNVTYSWPDGKLKSLAYGPGIFRLFFLYFPRNFSGVSSNAFLHPGAQK